MPRSVNGHSACPGPVIQGLRPAQRPDDGGAAYPARVNFVVFPHDGANLKVTAKLPSPGDPVPMRCPACGRLFELVRGNVVEQPPPGTENGPEV